MASALMVSSSFLPGHGGIESYLAELCNELAPRLAVFAATRRGGRPLPRDLGYAVHGWEGSTLAPTRRLAGAIAEAARGLGTDRILFGTPWPLVLLGPRLIRTGLRYAVIVHGAELLAPSATPVLRRRFLRALSRADLLLPVSEHTAGHLRKRLGGSGPPVAVLRARVDLSRFNPQVPTGDVYRRLGLRHDARIVLSLGRLVRRKGVDRLVRAVPELRRIPHTVLVVAGTGPDEQRLRRLARGNDDVLFTGRIEDELVPALYAAADVFALPVIERWFGLEVEGLGIALLEAAACGTPCLTGRSGGTPEAVIDRETGFVVDASNQSEVVEKLSWLLEHEDEAERMGAMGRLHVAQSFSEHRLPEEFVRWLD